jgi:hypothetical protein
MKIFRYKAPASPVNYVEAETAELADRIYEYVTDDKAADAVRSEVTDPPQQSLARRRAFNEASCEVSLIGGYYSLQFRQLNGWAEVARVKFGPLWTMIYNQAAAEYGEDNVRYRFTKTAGWYEE